MNDRYSRQQLFQPIGEKGQELLQQKHVLIVGAGALGRASAEAIVRAGVGKVTIVDRDYVEWSNLQRQQLYSEEEAEQKIPKAVAAQDRLKRINSNVEIHGIVMDARAESLEGIVHDVDVMIDGTDNFDIRFVINDLSQKYKIPWIYGSCVGSYGTTYTIIPEKTPCLHCLIQSVPNMTITCDTAGIISPTVQMVAAYQVAEALKILVGDWNAVCKTYRTFDVWNNQHYEMRVQNAKKDDCPSCGEHADHPYLSYENQTKVDVLCGRNAVQIRPVRLDGYNLDYLAQQLQKHGTIQQNPYLLSCQLKDYRLVIFKDGRVLVHGTNDVQQAKNLYYSLLG